MNNEWRRGAGDKPCFALVLQAPYQIAKKLGLPGLELFRGTGLDERALDDPYTVIGRHQALAFYQNLAIAGPPDIGLDVGLSLTMNQRGSHGYLLAAADTVQSAILLGHEYYDLFYQHVGWVTRLEGNLLTHRFTEERPLGTARQFCMDRILAIMQVGAKYFSDGALKPGQVILDIPPPPHAARYEEIFQCPVLFSQDTVEIQYSSSTLSDSVNTRDPQVQEIMKSLCQDLLKRLHGRQGFVEEVRRTIHLIQPGHFPNIEQVAERLGCAPRTLRRKLHQEQETFQNILDEERKAVACDYLQNSNLSIGHIAERCGFQSPQNFSHAFRGWTGLSPSKFRKTIDDGRGS